jgi:hypothetical protein
VAPPDGEPPPDGGEEPPPEEDRSVEQLLTDAQDLFEEADAALEEGNLGEYQDKVEEARGLIAQALEAGGGTEAEPEPDTTTTTEQPTGSA